MAKSLSTADKKIQGLLGKAIREYGMIEDGDRVAVAVSGGKDSLALLYMLKERLKWIPIKYDLLAIHLDMGFEGTQPRSIETTCREMGVPFYFEPTDYGIRAHRPENKENPCFLCAWLRRKHLFELSKTLKYTKIAFGHNKDDIIETLFLNMFFSGELSTMLPRQSMFKGGLTIIRPLALLKESQVKGFAQRTGLPEIPNPCPSAGNSSRKEIKNFLSHFYARNRKIQGNIFHALSHVRPEYLLPTMTKGKTSSPKKEIKMEGRRKMSKLFESTEINGMKLANRFVRSATWEGMAEDDGTVTPALIDCMAKLAQGQIGLIISSHAYIKPEGQAGIKQLGIYKDELIAGLRQMTEAVHHQGGRIVLQMAHAGYFAKSKLTDQIPFTPSIVEKFSKSPRKEMTVQDIQGLVESFGLAAKRAKEAGFDGVQIHAAHGYLLSQFISPLFNKRTDAYGGSVENRARVIREVLQKVRSIVGDNFPVIIKINSEDYLEGGLTLEDSLKIGVMLQEDGLDAIELSGGTFLSGNLSPSRVGITTEEKEAYFLEAAKVLKQNLQIPLILVGGLRSFQVAERIIEGGYADYISMSRAFIREPGLIKRWHSGDFRKAFCLSDNLCFGPAMAGEGIYCVVEKKEKEKALKERQD